MALVLGRKALASMTRFRNVSAAAASNLSIAGARTRDRYFSTVALPEGGVTLRYFEGRGRAQALRYALVDAGVEFKDDKVSIQNIMSGNWYNMKSNAAVSGPFGTLPVMDWGSTRIGQTEAIAGYLYHKLGHGEGGTPEKAAMSAAITSLGHQDMIVLCIQLVNVVGSMSGITDEQVTQSVQSCQARVNSILPHLETLINNASTEYLLGDTPCMGDYFAMEALDVVTLVLGESMLDGFPECKNFRDRMQERPKIKEYMVAGSRPLTLTGTAQEVSVMMMLKSIQKL